VAQNPTVAEMPFMPHNAILNTDPDYVLDNQEILKLLSSINT
jgi:two-component system chemotaxis response regulator CheB